VDVTEQDMSRATGCFPLVGGLIGALLWFAHSLLSGVVSVSVEAVLLLAFWAMLTGGVHLNGLAGMADGWLDGRGDRIRALEMMKDSRLGTGGVVALLIVLLLKWLLLSEALAENQSWLLLLAPVGGRIAAIALIPVTRYASVQSLGEALHQYSSKPVVMLWVAWLVIGVGLGFGWLPLVLLLGTWLWLRWLMVRITGGMTDGTAGAMTEVMETVLLGVLLYSSL
jgi:adenosylcobinamide-GDP ribazoletransferase